MKFEFNHPEEKKIFRATLHLIILLLTPLILKIKNPSFDILKYNNFLFKTDWVSFKEKPHPDINIFYREQHSTNPLFYPDLSPKGVDKIFDFDQIYQFRANRFGEKLMALLFQKKSIAVPPLSMIAEMCMNRDPKIKLVIFNYLRTPKSFDYLKSDEEKIMKKRVGKLVNKSVNCLSFQRILSPGNRK